MSEIIYQGDVVVVVKSPDEAPRCFIKPNHNQSDAIEELSERIDFLTSQRNALNAGVNFSCEELKGEFFGIANECDCRADHGAQGADHLKAIAKMIRKAIHDHEMRPE